MGEGGVAFHNSGHRLAFGHVNDMRCLEKVHAFLFVFGGVWKKDMLFYLFDLILYIPSTIFQR